MKLKNCLFSFVILVCSSRLLALDLHVIRLGGLPSCAVEKAEKTEKTETGFTLVPDYATRQFDQFVADIKKSGKSVEVTFSCFGPEIFQLIASRGQVDFRFQKYRGAEPFVQEDFSAEFVSDLEILNQNKIPKALKSFFDYVLKIQKDQKPTRTVVLGISYGAWLGMQLVALQDLKVDLFVTVDAISPVNCNVNLFWKNWNVVQPGCVIFPQDIKDKTLEKVQDLAKNWVNFYQRQFYFLHSTRSVHADENILLQVPEGYKFFNNQHAHAIESPEIWELLSKKLSEL